MSGDGAESTATKASTMKAYGEFDHLVGRDAFAFVFRMWQTDVREVKRAVEFILSEGLIRGIDDRISAIHLLNDALCSILVRFLLNVTEIFGLGTFVAQTLLVAMQYDVIRTDAAGYVGFV